MRLSDRTWRLVVVGMLVLAVTIVAIGAVLEAVSGGLAMDFRHAYLPAADAIMHGQSPYAVSAYVYPPQLAFVLTPLTLLPDDVAALVALVAVAGLLIATLAVLRVQDRLCYLAVFAWAPTWHEINMASITPALALGVALTWHYRDRTWPPAIALGLAVSAKVFLWPVLVWTLAARRLRLSVLAVVVGMGVTFSLWAILGFQGVTEYPALLQGLSARESIRGDSYSFVGIATALGVGEAMGQALMLLSGVALIVASVVLARHGDDRRSFLLALAAALALTPILWLHYLVLLVIPLAIARPRFTPLWLLPVVLWVGQSPMSPSGPLSLLPALVAVVLVARLVTGPTAVLDALAGTPLEERGARPGRAWPARPVRGLWPRTAARGATAR